MHDWKMPLDQIKYEKKSNKSLESKKPTASYLWYNIYLIFNNNQIRLWSWLKIPYEMQTNFSAGLYKIPLEMIQGRYQNFLCQDYSVPISYVRFRPVKELVTLSKFLILIWECKFPGSNFNTKGTIRNHWVCSSVIGYFLAHMSWGLQPQYYLKLYFCDFTIYVSSECFFPKGN